MPENNERNYPPRRRRKPRPNYTPLVFILTAVLIAVIFTAILMGVGSTGPDDSLSAPVVTEPSSSVTKPSEGPTTPPTDPPVTVTGTATIGATGDMLMHLPCVTPAATGGDSYDFTPYFTRLSSYVQAVDYAVYHHRPTAQR